jgi:hypothetical protein
MEGILLRYLLFTLFDTHKACDRSTLGRLNYWALDLWSDIILLIDFSPKWLTVHNL